MNRRSKPLLRPACLPSVQGIDDRRNKMESTMKKKDGSSPCRLASNNQIASHCEISRSRPQKHKSSPPPLLRSRHESRTAVPSERSTVTARCRRRRLPVEIGISAGISYRTVYEDDCVGGVGVGVVPETKVGFSIPVRFVGGGDGEEVYFVKYIYSKLETRNPRRPRAACSPFYILEERY
ncbi:hypothetical protein L1987_69294 [Smallanthus sonchifolius]|uniref:Uncharacterized protein n=1 Tax=Smallanthus sonchifolius TaxID=185202 RepID=A0ACB9B682_9ASTR|nr:hypothetical protein L1987_69294 [Smallanthus sonchifolius]